MANKNKTRKLRAVPLQRENMNKRRMEKNVKKYPPDTLVKVKPCSVVLERLPIEEFGKCDSVVKKNKNKLSLKSTLNKWNQLGIHNSWITSSQLKEHKIKDPKIKKMENDFAMQSALNKLIQQQNQSSKVTKPIEDTKVRRKLSQQKNLITFPKSKRQKTRDTAQLDVTTKKILKEDMPWLKCLRQDASSSDTMFNNSCISTLHDMTGKKKIFLKKPSSALKIASKAPVETLAKKTLCQENISKEANDTTAPLSKVVLKKISKPSTDRNEVSQLSADGNEAEQPSADGNKAAQPSTDRNEAAQPFTNGNEAEQPSTDGNKDTQPSKDGNETAQSSKDRNEAQLPSTDCNKLEQPSTNGNEDTQPSTDVKEDMQPSADGNEAAQSSTDGNEVAQPSTNENEAKQSSTDGNKGTQPSPDENEDTQPSTNENEAAQPSTDGNEAEQLSTDGNEAKQSSTDGKKDTHPSADRNEAAQPSTNCNEATPPSTDGNEAEQPFTDVNEAEQPFTDGNEDTQLSTDGNEDTQQSTDRNEIAQPSKDGNGAEQPSTDGNEDTQPSTDGNEAAQPSTDRNEATQPSTDGNKDTQPFTDGNKDTQTSTDGNKDTQPSTVGNEGTQPSTVGNEGTQPSTDGNEDTQPSTDGNEDTQSSTDSDENKATEPDGKKKQQKKKPYRPCPFCYKEKSKLSSHLKRIHKNEPRVRHALSLPAPVCNAIIDQLRKEGILLKNRKILADDSITDKHKFLEKERRSVESELVMCSACKGFYAKSNITVHKTKCPGDMENYAIPVTILTSSICSEDDSFDMEEEKMFYEIILSHFREDEIGKVCQTDKLIKIYGLSKFHRVLTRIVKKQSIREKLMGDMRRLASLYVLVKKKASLKRTSITSCNEMFDITKMGFIQDALREMTKKEDGSLKAGLCCNIGYVLKNTCSVMKGYYLTKDNPSKAMQFDKFLSVLSLYWDRWFGEAEYENKMIRQSKLRKPKRLPKESDIAQIRNYNVGEINRIVSNEYEFMAPADFVKLRDLIVCRLTLFNARRGGEPARLLLREWHDAENDEWIDKNVSAESIIDPEEKAAFKDVKVTYQVGKNLMKMVPLLIPKDCLEGIKKIADPIVRQDAGIKILNPFLFATLCSPSNHVKGWLAVRNICDEAGVTKHVTATSVRHRASTIYSTLEVPQNERCAFFSHMGHSEEINKHVYQAPMAVVEVTKIGKFFKALDNATGGAGNDLGSCVVGDDCNNEEDENVEEFHNESLEESNLRSSAEVYHSESNEESDAFSPNSEDTDSSDEGEYLIDKEEIKDLHYEKPFLKRKRNNFRASWTSQEEKILMEKFRNVIHDFSLSGTKGTLPGRPEIREFLAAQPNDFLQGMPFKEKVNKIHTKLFNERAKIRKKTLDQERNLQI